MEDSLPSFLNHLAKGKKLKNKITFKRLDCPYQRNAIDCGVFMLYFIDKIARNNPSNQSEIISLFNQKEAHQFRLIIKDALMIHSSIL